MKKLRFVPSGLPVVVSRSACSNNKLGTIPKHLALSLFAATALLPSCAQWQLGEHMSDAQTTYTGVNLCCPVDGKFYRPAELQANQAIPFYITAPEVTFKLHPHPRLRLCEEIPDWLMYAPASEVEPTGRIVTARITDGGVRGPEAEEIPALPDGLIAEVVTDTCPEEQHMLAILSEKREEPSLARRALIGTCDYLLDPLLTLISTPVYVTSVLVRAPFIVRQNSAEATETQHDPLLVPEMPYEGTTE